MKPDQSEVQQWVRMRMLPRIVAIIASVLQPLAYLVIYEVVARAGYAHPVPAMAVLGALVGYLLFLSVLAGVARWASRSGS